MQTKVVLLSFAVLFPTGAMAQSDPIWVPGSSQKVCQPNGEIDYQTLQPTVSQTQTNYGLIGDDLGASFEHNGKLYLLFGDTNPTAAFNGKPNSQSDPPRTSAANDAIAFTSGTNIDQCLKLDFVRDSIGGFQNPVVLNAQGKPAIPAAFLGDRDRMARFQRQAEALTSLDHPNIGPIFGPVDSADSRALVLALNEGLTLADGIDAGPHLLEMKRVRF